MFPSGSRNKSSRRTAKIDLDNSHVILQNGYKLHEVISNFQKFPDYMRPDSGNSFKWEELPPLAPVDMTNMSEAEKQHLLYTGKTSLDHSFLFDFARCDRHLVKKSL